MSQLLSIWCLLLYDKLHVKKEYMCMIVSEGRINADVKYFTLVFSHCECMLRFHARLFCCQPVFTIMSWILSRWRDGRRCFTFGCCFCEACCMNYKYSILFCPQLSYCQPISLFCPGYVKMM